MRVECTWVILGHSKRDEGRHLGSTSHLRRFLGVFRLLLRRFYVETVTGGAGVSLGDDIVFNCCTRTGIAISWLHLSGNCLQNSIISLDPKRPMGYDQIPEIPLFGGIRTGKIPVWVRHTSKSGETVLGSQFFVRVDPGPKPDLTRGYREPC